MIMVLLEKEKDFDDDEEELSEDLSSSMLSYR